MIVFLRDHVFRKRMLEHDRDEMFVANGTILQNKISNVRNRIFSLQTKLVDLSQKVWRTLADH